MKEINNEANEVETAKAKVEAVRQGILEGNQKLTARDLSEAKDALEFAELRQEARRAAEEKAAAAARRANLLDLQKQLSDIADTRPVIEKKFNAFEKSLTDYLSAVVVHQKELQAVRDAIQSGGFAEGFTPGPIEGIDVSIGRTVEIGATIATSIEPNEAIKQLTERLLGEFSQNLRSQRLWVIYWKTHRARSRRGRKLSRGCNV
jgi:hypothetical protein